MRETWPFNVGEWGEFQKQRPFNQDTLSLRPSQPYKSFLQISYWQYLFKRPAKIPATFGANGLRSAKQMNHPNTVHYLT